MQLLEGFKHFLQQHQLHNPTFRFLVAVSGGIDSVVLCSLCKEAGLSFAIAHCNFELRGQESERDEAFVASLAKEYNVPFFVEHFHTAAFAAENKCSIQEAARTLRYQWFEATRKENHFHYVLLAHHASDNVETVLMHFFRGTGLEGLIGMPFQKEGTRCLRPLLLANREQIMQYAAEKSLHWVEDSSNASVKYTRTFLRNEVLPQIKKVYPQAEENIQNNIERFQKIQRLYQLLVADFKLKFLKKENGEVRIPVLKLLSFADTALIYEIIKDFGFGEKQVDEVLKLCAAGSGKYIQNENYQIIRHRKWLIIAPVKTAAADTIVIEKKETLVRFKGGMLQLSHCSKEKFCLNDSANTAQLDAGQITFPLLLRKWKAGDYFYPLGLRKKKKLARFFIDQKLSKTDKENIWVLESDQRIVWIVGQRIDDRFKVTEKTKEVLQMELSKLRL